MNTSNKVKKMRHMRILELIDSKDVETQEELMNLLRASGFEVTQATVSRDIRELKLTKATDKKGIYKYKSPSTASEYTENKYATVLYEAVISCTSAMNLVIVKTFSGMAPAAAAAVDYLGWESVLGSIAGDDNIFIACKTEKDAVDVKNKLTEILNSKPN